MYETASFNHTHEAHARSEAKCVSNKPFAKRIPIETKVRIQPIIHAEVAKLADALALGASGATRESSNLSLGKIFFASQKKSRPQIDTTKKA